MNLDDLKWMMVGGLVIGAILAGGCGRHQAPPLEVQQVAITEQTAEAVVVSFVIRASNRNSEPLPLRDVRYSMSVNGRQVFEAVRSGEATIPRFGQTEFTVPVALTLGEGRDLPDGPVGQVPYELNGTVEYLLPGTIAEVLFDSDIRRPKASFSESGRLDFTATPPMSVGQP